MWRRLLSDNAALGLQYAANALVPLLLVPHFVRVLGLDSYGILAILVSLATFAAIVVQYAFHLTGPAEYAALRGEPGARQLFLDLLLARLLLFVGVAAIVGAGFGLALAAGVPVHLLWREAIVLLGLPAAAALSAAWFLQALGRFGVLALLSVIAVAAALALGFGLVGPESPNRAAAALAIVTAPLLLGGASLAVALSTLTPEPARLQWSGARGALSRGAAAFSSQLIAALYTMAGPLVLGGLSGVRAAGLYSAIERPASALLAALTLTHTAAYPRASMLYAGGELVAYRRLIRQVLLVYAAGAALLGAALWLGQAQVQEFIFGGRSPEGRVLLWLAYGWIAMGIAGPVLTGYFTVGGRAGEILRLTLVVLLVSLPAGVIGAATWGATGWLAAALAGQAIVVARGIQCWRQLRQLR